MPFPNEHALRLRWPDTMDPDSFRRTDGGRAITVKDVGRINVPASIDIVWAKLKDANAPDDPVLAQSLRFPVQDWTESEAREWIADNGLDDFFFEPAEPSEENKKSQFKHAPELTRSRLIQRQKEAELY